MIKNRPPVHPLLAERARYMRSHMTPEEKHLWYDFLKTCGYKFNRQYVLGTYIVDFYSPELKLIVEVDGRQHYERLRHRQCQWEELCRRFSGNPE